MKILLWGAWLVVSSAVGAVIYAQQTRSDAPTLSAEDWIEIRSLYSRYPTLLDNMNSEADARAVADLWAEDGVLDISPTGPPHRGRKAVASHFANLHRNGSDGLNTLRRHYSSINVLIEPSPEGAVGQAYFTMMVSGAKEGQPSHIDMNGVYDDTFVKTRDGWKFKVRKFRRGPGQAPPQSAR